MIAAVAQLDDSKAQRLEMLFKEHPEADANSDGELTMEEARAFLAKQRGMKKGKPESEMPEREGSRSSAAELKVHFEAKSFGELPYRWMPPIDQKSGETYPLILVLHGAGGKGTDNEKNLVGWMGPLVEKDLRTRYPAFVAVPQAAGTWGERGDFYGLPGTKREPKNFLPPTLDLVERLIQEHPIDRNRIFVVGASMGGYGSWSAINARPDLFAAAIPVCGGHPPDRAAKFRDVPIWAFHGADDDKVPVHTSQELFQALCELGGNMKYTELAGVGHGAAAYAFIFDADNAEEGWKTEMTGDRCDPTPKIWDWLFAQRKSG
ncbi:MAG: prolyl oligopeptidase family serine peptidase [Verrucomicrobiota bacterium]